MSETRHENAAGCGTSGGCLCGGNGPRLTAMAELLMPSGEAGAHFRQAQVELLKGLRALLDQRIEAMSHQPAQGTKLHVD